MEHTVDAYLKRLSDQALEAFLQDYMNGSQKEDYSNIIGLIVQELARRKKSPL